ncbi:hypothetical protein [Spongorhabdus nitratireducens]
MKQLTMLLGLLVTVLFSVPGSAVAGKNTDSLDYAVIKTDVGYELLKDDQAQGRDRRRHSFWVFSSIDQWYEAYPNVQVPGKIAKAFQSNKTVVVAFHFFTTTSGGVWVRVADVRQTKKGIEAVFLRPQACPRTVNKMVGQAGIAVALDPHGKPVSATMDLLTCQHRKDP